MALKGGRKYWIHPKRHAIGLRNLNNLNTLKDTMGSFTRYDGVDSKLSYCDTVSLSKGEEEKVLFVANAGNYYIINL
jgi:hypothetical protein